MTESQAKSRGDARAMHCGGGTSRILAVRGARLFGGAGLSVLDVPVQAYTFYPVRRSGASITDVCQGHAGLSREEKRSKF